MSGAALVAIAASIGNLLQGWDNATIAGNSSAPASLVLFLLEMCSLSVITGELGLWFC